MRALIFAAGKGERMRPLTNDLPKALLQVKGRALIDYHVSALAKIGVNQIVVNVAYLGEKIENHLGDGQKFGVPITYSREGIEPLETGGGMRHALAHLGDKPFIAVNADIYTDFDFSKLLAPLDGLAHLVMVPNPAQHPQGDFAMSNGLLRVCGTPKYTFSGIGVYDPAIIASLPPGMFKLGPILREAMDFARLTAQLHEGVWNDIGTPERLALANKT
jgi:N-acetyl-alpha-D-muramate 1-phosphate uridylyltransferase